jgi:hypothetical protein
VPGHDLQVCLSLTRLTCRYSSPEPARRLAHRRHAETQPRHQFGNGELQPFGILDDGGHRATPDSCAFLCVGGWGPSPVEVAATPPPVDLGPELAL